MEYKKGLVEIVQTQEPDKCTNCNREVQEPFEIRRSGKVIGQYGPKCVEDVAVEVIKANESSKFGLISPGLNFVDYFKRPKVSEIRAFERVEPSGNRRTNVLHALIHLKDGQYLHIPADVALHPNISNWRKKGYFIEVQLPTKEEVNERRLSPRDAAKNQVGRNLLAYSGLKYFNKADNTNRIFSLMALIEGRKIAYLCAQEDINENIEIESDQGPTKVLWVPSTSRKGEYHRVTLKHLPVDAKDCYSRAFEFDYSSTSEDSAYNNMPWSNIQMPNGNHYRFSPIRPDKFACAALDYLMSRTDNDILVDPRPVVPSNLACKLENRMLTRAVHGSRLVDGQDIEIQLWMASNKKSLGYNKMFY